MYIFYIYYKILAFYLKKFLLKLQNANLERFSLVSRKLVRNIYIYIEKLVIDCIEIYEKNIYIRIHQILAFYMKTFPVS